MTTPASGVISLTDVMTELRISDPGRAYPISLGDADVRALAGVPSGAIGLTDLYGKSSAIGSPLIVTGDNDFEIYSSAVSDGTAFAHPSVIVSGGIPGYTYLWTITNNPDSCSLGNSTSQTCFISKAYFALTSGTASVTLQCQVTDSIGTITVETGITGSVLWETGA